MGNATSLAYDITEQVEFKTKVNWSLHNAYKKTDKEDNRESVSLFRISKTTSSIDLALAQRTIQKLRTLKHPFVLKFIDSADMDDSLALVTEPCIPLESWIAQLLTQKKTEASNQANPEQEDIEVKLQEVLWGFKCILMAINFLHTKCSLLHGNLGLHSLFVTPNGDWKLSGLELAGNMVSQSDVDHFIKHAHVLDAVYCPQERMQVEALTAKNPPYYIDMYSFGQCMQRAFNLLDLDMPRSYGKYLSSMLHVDMKKRPTAQKLLESALFNSEHLQFIESIGELALKEPREFLDIVAKMEPKVAGLSRAVCGHKILPNLARALQIAINDFPQRDAREGCRQSIQVSVNLLSKLAAMGKLDPQVFRHSWVPILVQLWAMSDRSVRTVMLQSLKSLAPFIPDAVINRSIFDNILAGFSDSNAKLRENTLMSLIFVVEKLEETQLQDRLVRSVVNLQNDAEPSIRTNATIFLGKISVKLKDAVRARVLCSAFQKAMKDNFLHCRVAGLRTSNACVKLLDIAQIATKIVPQASILLLDKSTEVRSLALTLVESCLEALRANHESMRSQARSDAGSGGGLSSSSSVGRLDSVTTASSSREVALGQSSSSHEAGGGSSWSSWAVLQGLSKSIESATLVGGSEREVRDGAAGSKPLKDATLGEKSHVEHISTEAIGTTGTAHAVAANGWEAELGEMLCCSDDDGPESRDLQSNKSAGNSRGDLNILRNSDQKLENKWSRSGATAPAGNDSSSWEAHMVDLGLSSDDEPAQSQPRAAASLINAHKGSGGSIGGLSVASSTSSKANKPIGGKAVKPAVTKLAVSKDEAWDDF